MPETRRELAAAQDEKDALIARAEDHEDAIEEVEPVKQLIAALRTIQVTGQVLKNYPGHLDAEQKLRLARAVYQVGTKLWTAAYGTLQENREELAATLVASLHERDPGAGSKVLNDRAQNAIIVLVYACGLGVVRQMSHALGAPELSTTYDKLVESEGNTEVATLLRLALNLDHRAATPESQLLECFQSLSSVPLGSWIVRMLAVEHFNFFPVPARVKQRICAKLGIEYTPAQWRVGRRLLPTKK